MLLDVVCYYWIFNGFLGWSSTSLCFPQPCALPVYVSRLLRTRGQTWITIYVHVCHLHLCNLTLKAINLILGFFGAEGEKRCWFMDRDRGSAAPLSWMIIHHRGQDCLDTVGAEERCISYSCSESSFCSLARPKSTCCLPAALRIKEGGSRP